MNMLLQAKRTAHSTSFIETPMHKEQALHPYASGFRPPSPPDDHCLPARPS